MYTLIGGQAGASTTGDVVIQVWARYSLYANTSGIYNTVIGDRAGRYITSGNKNVALGGETGMRITTGERNVCIGYGVGPTTNEATDSFKLYIDTIGDVMEPDQIHLFMEIRMVVIKI